MALVVCGDCGGISRAVAICPNCGNRMPRRLSPALIALIGVGLVSSAMLVCNWNRPPALTASAVQTSSDADSGAPVAETPVAETLVAQPPVDAAVISAPLAYPTTIAAAPVIAARTHPALLSDETRWSVQIGLFSIRENAKRMVDRLRSRGLGASMTSNAQGQLRVRVAGLPDRRSAEMAAVQLKSAGFPAAVIAPD